ncbi:MAG: hypothetical protein ACI4D8_03420 [Wujia sp.]
MSTYYNQGFLYKARQTVYKWWCVVYKPAYKLFHHGYWPEEKEPYYIPPDDNKKDEFAEQMAKSMEESKQNNEDDILISMKEAKTIDQNVLDRANEIMERLAREAAEDEAKKQAQIEDAKRIAIENERLAEIMNANKVDISAFIEEGKAQQKNKNTKI